MKKIYFLIVISVVFFSSCTTSEPITKSVAYKRMYDEKPLTVLIMPPINKTTNVDAKEYFHSTLCVPLANAGFYVLPTFLSMEILKKESAYDAELFVNAPLALFGEVFGANLAIFTIIHKWEKSALAAKVYVQVEYIIKSTKTNEIVYTRIGEVTYDASVNSGVGGAWGAIADMTASAIKTTTTNYVDVARACNAFTFKDLPAGKYSPSYGIDREELAGKKSFRVILNSNYRF